jgi:hypothetical protein
MLSSDADINQGYREYIHGDLILNTDKSIYTIKKEDDVYDIEFIGKLRDDNLVKDFKDNVINVLINVYFGSGNLKITSYRHYDTSKSTKYLRIEPSIYTLKDTNYDYFLRIHLYNKKTFQFGDYAFDKSLSIGNYDFDLSLTNNNMEFYKKMEIPLFDHQKDQNGNFPTYNSNYTMYVPEMALDKMHPSGNDIDVKASRDELGGYNIIFDSTCKNYGITRNLQEPFDNTTQYEKMHTQVQFTKYEGRINYRGGESCYFSALRDSANSLAEYLDETISDSHLYNEMFNFISSDKNIYELVCVNKTSHKIEVVNLKDSNIKMKIVEHYD